MDAQPYARCTYMDETFMFFLDIKHSFSDIVREVCLGFKSLKHGSFDLRYAFPGYSSCVLSNDVDLTLMWRCMYDFKLQSVDILVKDCGSSSVSSVVTHADDYSCISSSISVLPSSIVDGPEYLGHYRPEPARIYLTNEWQGFIKHVGQKFEGGALEFRQKLTKYAIELGFTFKFKRNNAQRIIVECAKRESEHCKWHVRALKCNVNDFFYIKELNNKGSKQVAI
ncbi:hypothetical protein ACLB2K_029094 [Fragaria x ananassa]